MRYLLAIFYTVILAVIINVFAALFNESYEYVAVHFLVGGIAGILASLNTKGDE